MCTFFDYVDLFFIFVVLTVVLTVILSSVNSLWFYFESFAWGLRLYTFETVYINDSKDNSKIKTQKSSKDDRTKQETVKTTLMTTREQDNRTRWQ